MSGTEIVEKIEKQTEGNWKPSSGSIYPLLAWLSEKGFTKELPKDQDGNKRYRYTKLGNEFLKKQLKVANEFQNKMEFLAPLLVRGLPLGINQEKFKELYNKGFEYSNHPYELEAQKSEENWRKYVG